MDNNHHSNASAKNESEIDIFNILFFAWENKLSLFKSGMIFFILGVIIYLFILPHVPSHHVKIEYKAPSSSLVAQLNNLPLNNEISAIGISKEKVLAEFQDEFNSYEILFEVMKKLAVNETKNLSELEKNAHINSLARRFYIDNTHINFLSTEINNDLDIIMPSLRKIVSKTGNNIRIEIQNQIYNSIDGLDRDIDAKNSEINSIIDKYSYDLKYKINFLRENLELSKKLNITENQTGIFLNDEVDDGASMQMYINDSNPPYYLRGSIYIEEELNSLEDRESIENYIHELPALKSQVNLLKYKKQMILESSDKVIKNLPLNDENLIRYNVNDIQTLKNKNKRIFIPVIFLFLGIIFQLLTLYLREKYTEYKKI